MTDDYDIGDVIRAALGNPLDAIAQASEPAIEEQVSSPTSNEQAEIEALAMEAAQLQDELRAAIGDKQSRLRGLTGRLKDQMLKHGMRSVIVAGRPPIELVERSNRKPTRKAIIDVLQNEELKQLTDEQSKDPKVRQKAMDQGKTKALNLWNKIEPTISQSITIPEPTPPEVDSPY